MSLRLVLLFAIVAVNGFFAAAEVALVSVRRSRLKQLAGQGNASARAALGLLAKPERLLSVTQVGVTLASLGLGWAGEDTVYKVLLTLFESVIRRPLTQQLTTWLHGVSFGLAFLAISYVHVVVGEVVPKNLAIDKAERLALLVAPALLLFQRISAPFVFVIERTAAVLSRAIGVRQHGGGGHSPEELKFIVETSRREGHLLGFEEHAIQKLLELKDINAREIMAPRIDIVSLPVDASLDELLRITLEHKYSRMPVYEGKPEHIIGIVHYKDLMRVWQERKTASERRQPVRPFVLRRYLREALVVPETKPLNQLVDEFRRRHTHLALVVDEFGTITGLVTLEDVLEQVFGEIGDEHDVRRPLPKAGAAVIEVDGSTNIRDLASQYEIELPGDAGFETLAGFLLFQLGYIPAPGESVTYGSRTFIVQEMDRNRITRVKIVTARPADTVST
ncbi:MAG: HlyC/CorC family transporter [Acidobacteria bacterium]|nr:MAG: HlyC/CorC family transporter [Acidobacteriota bacterium]